jgi:hypothetical protein
MKSISLVSLHAAEQGGWRMTHKRLLVGLVGLAISASVIAYVVVERIGRHLAAIDAAHDRALDAARKGRPADR